jgi:NAD(P)-dependent dehydrogenase (short-subunit alcohol dehydrogenase family)
VIGIDLAGRTALVTGGGRGLGREISLGLAAAGAAVVVNYLRDADAARAVATDICDAGGAAIAVQADVSHPGDVERLLATAHERFGALHVLVSNAALGVFRSPDGFDLRGVRRTFEISAWPLLDLAARLAPTFVAEGYGRVVAISSVGSRRSVPGYAALAMAKGAVEAVTPYLADHLGSRCAGATANAVVPVGFHDGAEGHVPHDALRRRLADDEARAPGGRYPTMAEVASVVVFLASDLASGINGQSLVVDRGWSVT